MMDNYKQANTSEQPQNRKKQDEVNGCSAEFSIHHPFLK